MIRNIIGNIKQITSQEPTDLCDLNTIVKQDIPRVDHLRTELTRLLEKFQKDYPGADVSLEDECINTIQVTYDWEDSIQSCHRQQGGNSTTPDKKDIKLTLYQRNGDHTIYTFFDNFEAYFKGCNQVDKARALFKDSFMLT